MPLNKIWIVEGSTGEYSDHCYWQVYAFTTEEKAEAYVAKLNEWCKEKGVFEDDDYAGYDERRLKCPLDPQFRADYTGTSYYCCELEIKE